MLNYSLRNVWKNALVGACILAGASAASAQGTSVPRIDVEKGCRAAEVVLKALFSTDNSDVLQSCINDEQAAHDQLVKDWNDFPPLAKRLCVQPNTYLPSYVEWQACLELTRDVIKMRKAAAQAGTAIDSGPRECPVVKIGDDGNIVSVTAC